MAGMFYSLKEVAEKLNKTESEIKEIVKQGKLREFRDGPSLLFKIDEVEALMSDTSIMASEQPPSEPEPAAQEDEIALVSEPEPDEIPLETDEMVEADTMVAGEGINVLGETNGDYQLADDTRAETKEFSGEISLEEIEEDVNLDTFGSGSGLLDLSLQADDTSLGGILDEIYTPEGSDGKQPVDAAASAMEVAAEVEQLSEEDAPLPAGPEVMVTAEYIEPEPDASSNLLGIMLFIPLAATVYATIIALAGSKGLMPGILSKTQGIMLYVMGAAVVAAIVMSAAGLMLGAGGAKAGEKAKKQKEPKEKKEKEKKEKGKKGKKDKKQPEQTAESQDQAS